MSDTGVADRLETLCSQGYLQTERKGRTRLYWLSGNGYQRVDMQRCSCNRELFLADSQ